MAGPLRCAFFAAALLVPTHADRQSGETLRCILDRAHSLEFDVSGKPVGDSATLADFENVSISIRPTPERDAECRRDTSYPHCLGVNEDATCQAAAESSLPLMFGLDCEDCFGAVALNTYYDLKISMFKLHSLGLGFQDVRFRASASLHKGLAKQFQKSGSWPMPGSGVKHTVLDTTVACPLCLHINIYVVFESNLDWSVTDTVNGNFRAGMTYKASLGSQMVRYDEGKGWSMETFHSPNVTRTPILEATGKAESSLKASMPSNLRLGVSGIGWVQAGTTPNFSGTLSMEASAPDASLCLATKEGFDVATEAAVDMHLAFWRPQYHWGPRELYSWSGASSKCDELRTTTTPASVVV